MNKIGTKREMAEFGGKFMLLLAAFLLIPIPVRADGSGAGGVVMMARVSGSGSGSDGSGSGCLTTGSGSGSVSVQAVFNQYAFLEFRGTEGALANLDSQTLALGSPEARLRVSSYAIAAAGSLVDLKIPVTALNGVTTWLNTAALGGCDSGGSGGVIFASAGSASVITAWVGPTIPLNLSSITSSPLLWNDPVEIVLVPANPALAVKLTVTVLDFGTVRLTLSPFAAN